MADISPANPTILSCSFAAVLPGSDPHIRFEAARPILFTPHPLRAFSGSPVYGDGRPIRRLGPAGLLRASR